MNNFIEALKTNNNTKVTENGATAHSTTYSSVYDLFAFGGAYRSRTNEDCINLFKKAFNENRSLAMKCLFYLRDVRGGQGERRFFRVCMKWLCQNFTEYVFDNNILNLISDYGRWDDLIYTTYDTKAWDEAIDIIREQLQLDLNSVAHNAAPSLLGKWLPSENASSDITIAVAKKIRKSLIMTSKAYRKTLSKLRNKIKIVETLMSQNRWEEIEFDKIPSKAGIIYRNAFARRDIIAKKYENFAKDENTKVNAKDLFPYEITEKCAAFVKKYTYGFRHNFSDIPVDSAERKMLQKYWDNLPDYFDGKPASMLCVIDTSGSMWGRPMDIATSLGIYCAERNSGDFANCFISFSSKPKFIEIKGKDIVDKVGSIYEKSEIADTNLCAVFEMLKEKIINNNIKKSEIPNSLVVISDMEINQGSYWDKDTATTEMEKIRIEWEKAGLKLPHLVYWNVDARHDTILDLGPDVSLVSGSSPIIFKQVITGKTGYDLMLETLLSDRYINIG